MSFLDELSREVDHGRSAEGKRRVNVFTEGDADFAEALNRAEQNKANVRVKDTINGADTLIPSIVTEVTSFGETAPSNNPRYAGVIWNRFMLRTKETETNQNLVAFYMCKKDESAPEVGEIVKVPAVKLLKGHWLVSKNKDKKVVLTEGVKDCWQSLENALVLSTGIQAQLATAPTTTTATETAVRATA